TLRGPRLCKPVYPGNPSELFTSVGPVVSPTVRMTGVTPRAATTSCGCKLARVGLQPSKHSGLDAFQHQGDTLAHADTHRAQSVTPPDAVQLIDRSHRKSRT